MGHVVACDQRRIHAGGDGRENNHIATSVAPADQGTVFRIGQDVSDAAGERRVFFAGPYRGLANPYPRHMTAQLTRIGAVFLPSNMTSMRFPDGVTRTEVT